MDGVLAVTARISEIRSMLAPPVSARTAATAAGSTSSATAPAGSPAAGSFADVLAVARTGAPTGVSVADLKASYSNGKIPAAALSPIGRGEHRLAAPAATAFASLEEAARRDGISFGVTDSYRSYEEQVDLVRRKGLYSQGGLAAAAGTSQHGWGLAVDLDLDPRAQAWMRANGPRFGFVEDTPREPWHWGFKG